jgi:hypothetical protein
VVEQRRYNGATQKGYNMKAMARNAELILISTMLSGWAIILIAGALGV